MEKKMENEMETRGIIRDYRDYKGNNGESNGKENGK